MHDKAKAWDRERGFDSSFATGSNASRPVPENRPCDWCGETVARGYIHKECAGKEAAKWLDILY